MQEIEEKTLLALPCILSGKPVYESDDGYKIFYAFVNEMSLYYQDVKDKIPESWIVSNSKNQRGNFVVCVTSDYPLFSDVPYVFMGEIVNHKTYGLQFRANDYFPDEPSNRAMMIDYLDRLPNVGKKRSKMIVDYFGIEHIADIIENKVNEISEKIPGITESRALEIQRYWLKDKFVRRVYMWILSHGISAIYGKKIIEHFGEDSIETLESNPYSLTEIKGIGFVKADEIAFKILKSIPRDVRTKSCINYVLREKEDFGHVCYPTEPLKREVCEMLIAKDNVDYDPIVLDVLKKNFVLYGDKTSGVAYAYLPTMFSNETCCAKFLTRAISNESLYSEIFTEKDVEAAENKYSVSEMGGRDFHLDDKQKEAIRSAFLNKITVITGGGGTGKSTICNAICYIARSKGLGITLFAPTGQAAKVLERKTGIGASTIHRGLGLVPGKKNSVESNPGSMQDGTIRTEILIIDEFSMVGTDLLPYVFNAIVNPSETNIVLVGDPQQLPSVSPGNNLHDIINCGCANVVKLGKIYRQSEKSYISLMADEVSRGKAPGIPIDADDFFWSDLNDSELILKKIEDISRSFYEKGELKDLQIMSSIYARGCGVDAINSMFQSLFTKSQDLVVHEKRYYFLGDRVMHVVNNYQKGIFNGNVGHIVDLGYKVLNSDKNDQPSYYIVVEFEDEKGGIKPITYENDEISELRVAWCSTVHKFQGAQKKYVIFLMPNDHRNMMYRELVYTAFTRAEKQLFVMGTFDMLTLASRRSIIAARYTNLQSLFKHFAYGEDNHVLKFPPKETKEKDTE